MDGRSYRDLRGRFGVAPQWPGVTLENLGEEIRSVGLSIEEERSWWGTAEFSDVGALVYYVKAIPWMVPGLSVERFGPVLMDLQRDLERQGVLRFGQGRVLIKARKQ